MSHYSGISRKRVLITGATSGLGFAMACALLTEGAKVLVGGRDQKKVDEAVGSLKSLRGECMGTLADVRDETSMQRAMEDMDRRWSGVDVLINNAGIGMRTVDPQFLTDPKPFWEISTAKFRDLIDTNLTGYFIAAKAVIPYFLRAGRGKIINISINQETMGRKGFVPYGPSRAASEALSHIMSSELAPFGVSVNLLLPGGATETGMLPEEFRGGVLPASFRGKTSGQMLQPEVMGEPALFLCSDDSDGANDERIVAKEFAQWKAAWLSRNHDNN